MVAVNLLFGYANSGSGAATPWETMAASASHRPGPLPRTRRSAYQELPRPPRTPQGGTETARIGGKDEARKAPSQSQRDDDSPRCNARTAAIVSNATRQVNRSSPVKRLCG